MDLMDMSKMQERIEKLESARRAIAAALVAAVLLLVPGSAFAQVVALVNGAPITELDIAQRVKLNQVTTGKSISRKDALEQLIDDHLKISVGKRYGLNVSDKEIDQAISSMAERSHISSDQLEKSLNARGVSTAAFRLKLRADIGWSQMVRGRYSASLQINDADIRHAMQSGDDPDKNKADEVGYSYTLYPIILIADQGQAAGRAREAENLRARFQSCDQGLKMVRLLRGAVVREPVIKGSADLPLPLRETLDKMDIGKLTAPEITPQGIQMFALCDRRKSTADTPAERAIRQQLFAKRFDAESKKFLAEVRRQSMIVYK
jgi:peptidyl-prolyl cis-trans isomerase SurA